MTNQEFTKKYYPLVKRITAGTGIFPETVLAAAIVESGSGTSNLSKNFNNFFGIKTGGQWTGPSYNRETKSILTRTPKTNTNNFRIYGSPADSFKNYVYFLQRNQRYKKALKATTYQEQIVLIANAGYAEESNYAQVLNNIAKGVKEFIPLVKNNSGTFAAVLGTAAALILYFTTSQSNENKKI